MHYAPGLQASTGEETKLEVLEAKGFPSSFNSIKAPSNRLIR
jgi:hypothetical protein